MAAKEILQYTDIVAVFGCISAISLVLRSHAARTYRFFVALLALHSMFTILEVVLLFHRVAIGLAVHTAYVTYFYAYWIDSVLEVALQLAVIYSVYRLIMEPMQGLQRIGAVIFRWVAVVSIVLSSIIAFGPHVQGWLFAATLLGQVQEGVSVLIICLLVFVCFATKPLGLSFRSRPFGIALGLGITATQELVLSSWASNRATHSLYSPVFATAAVVSAISLIIWNVYFALPEPERKLVLLPTTSPYFHWNSISEALGDDPGMVAVSGFTPAMLSAAELVAFAALKPVEAPEVQSLQDSHTEPVRALAASF